MGGCLCVSSFLCSPLFSSSLLPRPAQLALLRRSLRLHLRHRSPAPSTSSGSRRYFIRSWQATARPRVSGSAVSSSATPIASNVIILPADPSAAKALPWETLGGHLFSLTAQVGLAWRFGRFCALRSSARGASHFKNDSESERLHIHRAFARSSFRPPCR
jgi:hypothetical protein